MKGEFFAIVVTLAGSGIVIAFFDWIYRGWLQIEAEEARANALPWGDIANVPEELRLPGKKAGGRPRQAGEPVTHTHDLPVSHSGRAVK